MDWGLEGVARSCHFGGLGLLVWVRSLYGVRWTYLVGVAYDYQVSRECFSAQLGPGVAPLHGESATVPFSVWAWGVGVVGFVVFDAVADADG